MKRIVDKLKKLNKTISTMESCTGGGVSNAITNIEGASEILKFSAVTYSNEYKIKMGVSSDVIDKYSVYSEECSIEMSKKISEFAGSDFGVGVTGKLNRVDINNQYGEDNVVLVTKKGLSITFDEKDVRPVGRTAQGVIGMRLDSDDCVIGMEPIIVGSKAFLLAITENGFGKRTEVDEYRVQNRGGRGVITYKITPKTGDIVGIKIVSGQEDVMLITDTGTIIRINAAEISILGRSTQGVTLMRTNDGGKVVSIETITSEDIEETSETAFDLVIQEKY